MRKLFLTRRFFVLAAAALGAGAIFFLLAPGFGQKHAELTTAVAEAGAVRQVVSVSGSTSAEDEAVLRFPVGGVVESVLVRRGDAVGAGDILATLENRSLAADRAEAEAALRRAKAERAELLLGARAEERTVAVESVRLRSELLERTRRNEEIRVENARRTLLSGGLFAYTEQGDERATPPEINGTYACAKEGRYTLSMFRSNAESGYSFALSGLESGTFNASFNQPLPFGNCGLRARFDRHSSYDRAIWHIDIPNEKSPLYTANRNAYELALQQAASAIAVAEQELALAKAEAARVNAPARSEAAARAEASVAQARARVARLEAEKLDRVLRAPFSGVVVSVDFLVGETAGGGGITLSASERFELLAQVPEIDVGRLALEQRALVVFDAKDDEPLTARVDYIAPSATVIDGVGYFKTRLALEEPPTWLRGGLNADIDIIIAEAVNDVRIPRRALHQEGDGYYVLIADGNDVATSSVEIVLIGNDGYAAVRGLSPGESVVLR
jgi:RND family efflux transporter MFP subunit